jgi:hypothetical protein
LAAFLEIICRCRERYEEISFEEDAGASEMASDGVIITPVPEQASRNLAVMI